MSAIHALWAAKVEEAGLSRLFATLSPRAQSLTISTRSYYHAGIGIHLPGTPIALRQLHAAVTDYDRLRHIENGGMVAAYGFVDDDTDYIRPDAAYVARLVTRIESALTRAPADDTALIEAFFAQWPDADRYVYDPDSDAVYPASARKPA